MSQQGNVITDFIVHKLVKEAHQRIATIELRDVPLAVNPTVQRLVDHLHKLYAERTGKGYGRFEENEDEFPAPKYIRQHIIDEFDFFELSRRLMGHLQLRASNELLATGGYVMIAKIGNGATNFLLTAIVTDVIGAAITEGLEVVDSVHLDMSQLRVAGRVDLTAWQAGADRYISFLKGRGEVAGYFKLFLGCNDVLVALDETKKLVKGLEEFAHAQQVEPIQRDRLLEDAYNLLDELGKNGTPVSLEALANRLWPDEPELLRAKLAEEALGLSDGFVPDRRAIKGLIKFEGKSDYWKLVFDRKAIRAGDLRYDPNTDTIVLSNLPNHLRQELIEEIDDEPGEV
ncbi:nucleoid-associated protein [Chitinimonas sp.]|uniref:nucleoid-associated protein n=1 Tax=Chitinimonas sp. TaxID=1934313 RepID=UPI0035B005E9